MTMLRTLLLSLFLLFAQQGSLLHALSHGTAEHRKQESQTKTSSVCDKCISYSTVGSALNNNAISLSSPATETAKYIQYNHIIEYFGALTPSARAPPASLSIT